MFKDIHIELTSQVECYGAIDTKRSTYSASASASGFTIRKTKQKAKNTAVLA